MIQYHDLFQASERKATTLFQKEKMPITESESELT
jgi:hypothetical protein